MLRSGRIMHRKATPRVHHEASHAKPLTGARPPARLPSVSTRNAQVRYCTNKPDGKPDVDNVHLAGQARRRCITPPVIQATPTLATSSQIPATPRPEPFDRSTQALFRNVYDKLPLDHTKYTKIMEIPDECAVLSMSDVHVLVIQCRMFDSTKLTFPLNPKDARKVLASKDDLLSHVKNLRSNAAAHYIFSLEGVDKMRRALDSGYQPL